MKLNPFDQGVQHLDLRKSFNLQCLFSGEGLSVIRKRIYFHH
jgi:hypothetical protein